MNGNIAFINTAGDNVFGREYLYARDFNEDGRAKAILICGLEVNLNRRDAIVNKQIKY